MWFGFIEYGFFNGESYMTLIINNLTHERNNQILFTDIQFTLNAGELLQVRGSNGSGKSTMLRILAGYIEPVRGEILWNENSIFEYQDFYQQNVSYLGHQNGIKPYLTVKENLNLSAALANNKVKKITLENVLEKIHLQNLANTAAMQLSAGQKRRLALARLLLNPTTLWILDEPMTSLDAQGQTLLSQLLEKHLKNGGMGILATHHDLPLVTKTIVLGEKNV